jgi:hypothetical protein
MSSAPSPAMSSRRKHRERAAPSTAKTTHQLCLRAATQSTPGRQHACMQHIACMHEYGACRAERHALKHAQGAPERKSDRGAVSDVARGFIGAGAMTARARTSRVPCAVSLRDTHAPLQARARARAERSLDISLLARLCVCWRGEGGVPQGAQAGGGGGEGARARARQGEHRTAARK